MALPNPQSLVHTPPRITLSRFKALLASKNSPALPEADLMWAVLLDWNVDPSFCLAQFRVESQYGTSGHAKYSGSLGNMLFSENLTVLASGIYSPGNGYAYAAYYNYVDATIDYCRYLKWYGDQYDLHNIYDVTHRWLGPSKPKGGTDHINYVNTIVNDMVTYEYPEGTFYFSGDGMIYAGDSIGKDPVTNKLNGQLKLRYPIAFGDRLYRGPDEGLYLKTFSGKSGTAWYLGTVNGSNDWGAILVGTSVADPEGTIVYIPNIDEEKIVRV